MLSYLVIIYIFGGWCTYGIYVRHYMSYFPILYSTISLLKLTTFVLALLCILFRRLILFQIYIYTGKIPNIIC